MAQLCSVCNKNEMTRKCDECGVPLCDACVKRIDIEQVSPLRTHKGETTGGGVHPAFITKKVCPKCMKTVDFI